MNSTLFDFKVVVEVHLDIGISAEKPLLLCAHISPESNWIEASRQKYAITLGLEIESCKFFKIVRSPYEE